MAIFAPIPAAGSPFEGISQGMDLMNKFLAAPGERKKILAGAQQAQAKARESQMLANLMDLAYGGQGSGNNQNQQPYSGLSSNDQQAVNNLQPGESYTVPQPSSENTTPSNISEKAKERLQEMGFLKESPREQKQREIDTAYQKELGASDVKAMDEWNKTITSSSKIKPVLQDIQEISANPAFQAMYQNPELFGYDISYLKRFGNKEEQDLLNSLTTNIKSVFSSMGEEFKGAFREFELNLFNKATPNETDTLQGIISKNNTLLALRELVSKRLTMAQNIVRGSSGRISPANALEIADKQINAKEVRDQIKKQFEDSEKRQKEERKNRQEQNKESSPNENKQVKGEVELYSPQGKLIGHASKKDAANFLKDHKGYYQKVVANG